MALESDMIIILLLLGFMSGTLSVIAGIGGGVFFVTIMTIGFAIPINIAIDTSTFVILIAAAAGFITYYKDRRFNIKNVLLFAVFSIIGSLSCMVLLWFVTIESYMLKFLFAITLLIAGLNMIRKASNTRKFLKNNMNPHENFSLENHDYKSKLNKVIPLFFLGGFAAYLLGIGGGIINTPSLNIILGYPIHNSTAMSTGIIFFTAILNTIIKAFLGQIDYLIGIILATGAVVGSIFGAKISKKIPKMYLQFLVAITLMLLAIRMFF